MLLLARKLSTRILRNTSPRGRIKSTNGRLCGNEENNTHIAMVFSYSRDVERGHAKLYKKAVEHMIAEQETEYYVCQVCGYVSDGILPDECPICGARKEKFRKVV